MQSVCWETNKNNLIPGSSEKEAKKSATTEMCDLIYRLESDIGQRHGLQNELARTKGKEKQFVLFLVASS